mgnify:FL=1|jgi:hypothetical protein|tara:strand:- start:1845 stop:2093 length:249 start_codon:yes stop_codon:yes gene_type:complete
MSEDGRGQEYLDENVCLHENVNIENIVVKVFDVKIVHINLEQEYTTDKFDLCAVVCCSKCSATQEQSIDVDVFYDNGYRWVE